uniref:MORN repeat protein n=1 Tax=viral metagenome TaxID=1070528 RepID=A0A6C0BT66_9ZZZZ
MEVIKAQPVHNLDDDDENYKISLDLVQVDRIYINIFNTKSGISFKTFIDKNSQWYNDNIYIYRDNFTQLYNILKKSLIENDKDLNYTIIENKEKIILKIIYNNDMFSFNLIIDIPRYISDKGELEDRINSLEYQVERLRNKLNNKTMKINSEKINNIEEIYNKYGHLVYKGQMKNGKPHGKGIKYFEDAEVIQYEGEFKNGLYDGYGILKYNSFGNTIDGRKSSSGDYVGNFCKGLMNGEIFNDNLNGTKYYTNYKMGIQDGLYKYINKDGSVYTSNYKDGIQYGEWKQVDKDGKIISSGVAK